jgi:uncharacterized protein
MLSRDSPIAGELTRAIQQGDLVALLQLLDDHEGLAAQRIERRRRDGSSHTTLHVATDWPGYFPSGPEVVRVLIAAGADPTAPIMGGRFAETPLHYAASSDDLEVADALIEGGAELEAQGASIAGGPPLDNAVGYGCWHVARRLVEGGARVDRLWHAAALGMLDRLEELRTATPAPTAEEINHAFWQACHGGQRRVAEHLLTSCGADVNWIPDYADSTGVEVAGGVDTRRETMVAWLREHGGRPAPKRG